jgi:hypothetical protein
VLGKDRGNVADTVPQSSVTGFALPNFVSRPDVDEEFSFKVAIQTRDGPCMELRAKWRAKSFFNQDPTCFLVRSGCGYTGLTDAPRFQGAPRFRLDTMILMI